MRRARLVLFGVVLMIGLVPAGAAVAAPPAPQLPRSAGGLVGMAEGAAINGVDVLASCQHAPMRCVARSTSRG